MNNKEEQILKEIINYFKENKMMPTRRTLQKRLNFQSVNSITYYIKSLEKQNYLIRNKDNKLILNEYTLFYNNNLKNIKIINANNKYVQITLFKHKKYIAYQIHNDYFNNIGILRNDILVIEIKDKLKQNDLGLFLIDKKYRILRYSYQDGFYILSDKEQMILNKVKIIGKVILIERKI